MRTLLFTAYRNLHYHSKRYLFIFIAIASAVSLSILINGVAYGALESIKDKAARYFAGHVSISGYAPEGLLDSKSYTSIAQTISNSALPIRTVGTRTQYNRTDASLFFSGERVLQRKLIGVDFAVEGREFSSLPFQEGSWKSLMEQSTPGVLISSKAASILGCRVGDAVTLYLTTDTGQYNTADLIVAGIFQETSLFGYAAYLRKSDLNALMLRPMDSATDIALYIERNVDTEQIARSVAKLLSDHYKIAPIFKTRQERDAALATAITGPMLVIMSQNAQLAQIKQLLDAVLYVTYFILAVFMLISMSGILNTYRVLVHERRREIGTLRALGMPRSDVRLLFISEAALLALSASILGFVVGTLTMLGISTIDVSWVPGAGLFTVGGRLQIYLSPINLLTTGALMIVAAVIAAFGPARKAGDISPGEAMRSA